MASKREWAARVASFGALLPAWGRLRQSAWPELRVLAYHRVLHAFDEDTFPFDLELISASAAQFDWQMAHLQRYFNPVTAAQVTQALRGQAPLPPRAVLVTFDDGFADNHDVAFPILQRHGVPALFFLATDYIGSRQLFWFDKLVYQLLHTDQSDIRLTGLDLLLKPTGPRAQRRGVAAQLQGALKHLPNAQRLAALEQLDRLAQLGIRPDHQSLSLPMDWPQVRAMSAAGMAFGSHSASHPILANIVDRSQLDRELVASKALIEAQTQCAVDALAYPVGGSSAFNPAVVQATQQAGYKLAFSYISGVNDQVAEHRWALRRLHVERYTSPAQFAAMLELPRWFAK